MSIGFYVDVILCVGFLIVSTFLILTDDSWMWTGPLALSYMFMDSAKKEMNK